MQISRFDHDDRQSLSTGQIRQREHDVTELLRLLAYTHAVILDVINMTMLAHYLATTLRYNILFLTTRSQLHA